MSSAIPAVFVGLVIGLGVGAGGMLLLSDDTSAELDAANPAPLNSTTLASTDGPSEAPLQRAAPTAEEVKGHEAFRKVEADLAALQTEIESERSARLAAQKKANEYQVYIDKARADGFVSLKTGDEQLEPAEIARRKARAVELTASLTAALAEGSKDDIIKLMEEFRGLGTVTAKEYLAMWDQVQGNSNPFFGRNELKFSYSEFVTLMTPDFRDFALQDPSGDIPLSARIAATYNLPWDDTVSNENKVALYTDVLRNSNNPKVVQAAMAGLTQTGTAAVPALSQMAGSSAQDPAVRATAIRTMADSFSEETDWNQIDGLSNDPSPEVRSAVRYANNVRNPGASGLLVTTVLEGQARNAGVEVGDILVRYNNQAVTDIASLNQARQGLGESDSVLMEIWRGGQVVPFTINGGQIGINGRAVVKR